MDDFDHPIRWPTAELLVEWLPPVLARWCNRTMLMDPDAAPWVAEIIARNHDTATPAQIAKKIREHGEVLSKERRAELNIEGTMRLGEDYAAALLPRAGANPGYAAATIVAEANTSISREFQRLLIAHEGNATRRMIRGGPKDCLSVADYARLTVAPYLVPEFPLPDCNADHCRCSYTRPPFDAEVLDPRGDQKRAKERADAAHFAAVVKGRQVEAEAQAKSKERKIGWIIGGAVLLFILAMCHR